MARFRATIHGNRGLSSRLGTAKSGMISKVNGWNIGVKIIAFVGEDGNDRIEIYKTGGSNMATKDKLIHTVTET